MWPDEAQLILKKSTSFQTLAANIQPPEHHFDDSVREEGETKGGVIYHGKLAWIADRSYLEVICLESGTIHAVFDFDRAFKKTGIKVSCVEEIDAASIKTCILAVGLQLSPTEGSKVCLVSVQCSSILGAIDVFDKITTCHFIPKQHRDHASRSLLRYFDGCLAVGTDQGKVVLLDLSVKRYKHVINGTVTNEENLNVQECHVVFANLEPEEILMHHEQSRQEGIYFGIQLEVFENAKNVTTIIAIPFSLTLIVGLDDGRMVLYDLEDLQAFHLAFPPEKNAPLLYLSYIEPADDPRACVYVWALHSSRTGAIGVMHSIMFDRKYLDGLESVYKDFSSCSARLTMPFFDEASIPIACQSISKVIDEEEEQQITLCAIAWITSRQQSIIMIFDLNQWYKEQMPDFGDWRNFPSYTATFPLGEILPLGVRVDGNMITPFNSIQRPEEHFYPNSLRFDVWILTENLLLNACWPGLQSKVLDNLTKTGSKAILEPNHFVKAMISAALIPQYQEFNVNLMMGIDLKREFLLSIALEYNRTTFLKHVALAIADGSHIGNVPTEALGLSTMTDWIWDRARALKDMSNSYCVPLFDYSGRTIDCGMQKSLTHCTRQMNVIANLMEMICSECQQYIPEHVMKILVDQLTSIKLAAEYQEATQWLLNVGLLPEGPWRSDAHSLSQSDEPILVPYPYHLINSHYSTQRMKLSNRVSDPRSDISSPYIYIDMLIKNACDTEAITNLWKEDAGNGLYPPKSLQKLLRVLLISSMSSEFKHIIFVYLFMDINHVLGDGRFGPVVRNLIKFPAVFKMDPAIIKITQSFWYLDHGDLETAIEELNSPLCQERNLDQWQRDFLITTLLKQEAPNLALRILKSPGVPVDPVIEIETLLANDLISEAFKFQRAKGDANLLIRFFEGTVKIQKRELLLDLSLNEGEAKILLEFLEKGQIPLTENLHFVYLLQRSEFVDAVSLIDKLLKTSRNRSYNLDGPREILSIYHTTLEPTTRQLTYLAYSNPDKFQLKTFNDQPKPLSSSLIRKQLDPSSGIYQRSVLSIKEAGGIEMFDEDKKNDGNLPFLRRSELGTFSFAQKTQTNNVVYPVVINRNEKKRQLDSDEKQQKQKEAIQFNEYEGPSKRRKFDEVEIPRKSFKDYDTSILSRFNPTVKPSFDFTKGAEPVKFGEHLERTPEKLPPSLRSTQLTTPVVQMAQRDDSPEPQRFTPHSILKSTSKTNISRSVTPLSHVSRKSFESEEKSIRFVIPISSTDTTLENSILEASNQTLDTTRDVTDLSESVLSKDEFFSPNASIVQDELMMSEIKSGQQESEKVEGHEDLSFLADAPHPRPPIRTPSVDSSSKSSRSASPVSQSSPRYIRSKSKESEQLKPSPRLTRSKSRELEQSHEIITQEFTPETHMTSTQRQATTSTLSSTPIIAALGGKRSSQKSLSRMVIEANAIKQQMLSEIFGDYSKSSVEQSVATDTPSYLQTTEAMTVENSAMDVTDTEVSQIGFLSYEESGVLTGDTARDKEILKEMLGDTTINTTVGNVLGDSTMALINDSGPFLSESSAYEETRENLSVSGVQEDSTDEIQPNIVPNEPAQVIQQQENSENVESVEPSDETVTKMQVISKQQSSDSVVDLISSPPSSEGEKSKDHITIQDDSINISSSESEEDSSNSEDSFDKFANQPSDENDDEEPQLAEQEDYDLDDEEVVLEEEDYDNEDQDSTDEKTSCEPTPPKKPRVVDDDVISIGSSSSDDDDSNDNDEDHFSEMPIQIHHAPEKNIDQNIQQEYDPVEIEVNTEQATINQGLIISHVGTVFDETEYQDHVENSQQNLYESVYNVETSPLEPIVQPADTKLSEMLYGDMEVDDDYDDNDSLNLAIVEESTNEQVLQEPDKEEKDVDLPTAINMKVIEVIQNAPNHLLECVEETEVEPSVAVDPESVMVSKPSPCHEDISDVEIDVGQEQEVLNTDQEAVQVEVPALLEENFVESIEKPISCESNVEPTQSDKIMEIQEPVVSEVNSELAQIMDIQQPAIVEVVEYEEHTVSETVQLSIEEPENEIILIDTSEIETPNISMEVASSEVVAKTSNEPVSSSSESENVQEPQQVPEIDTTPSTETQDKEKLDSPRQSDEIIEEQMDTTTDSHTLTVPQDNAEPVQSSSPKPFEPDTSPSTSTDITEKPSDELPSSSNSYEVSKIITDPQPSTSRQPEMYADSGIAQSLQSDNQPEDTVKNDSPQPSSSNMNNENRKSIVPDDILDKTSLYPYSLRKLSNDDSADSDILDKETFWPKDEIPRILVTKEEAQSPKKTLRSRAISMDQRPTPLDSPRVKRILRASSVPKSVEEHTPKKSRRISTDTRSHLEQIEEHTPLGIVSTPTSRTRKISTDNPSSSGHVLTRSASRRLSVESTTPQRSKRGSSKEISSTPIKSRRVLEKAEEDQEQNTAEAEAIASSKKSDEGEDSRSERSHSSKRVTRRGAKLSPATVQEEPSTTSEEMKPKRLRVRTVSNSSNDGSALTTSEDKDVESYAESRRLTRKQKALMKKSLASQEPGPSGLSSISSAGSSTIADEGNDSDADSQMSDATVKSLGSTGSRKSGKGATGSKSGRKLRSSKVESSDQQETASVSSRGSRTRSSKRKATQSEHLEVIPEEQASSTPDINNENETSEMPPKKTRKQRKKENE